MMGDNEMKIELAEDVKKEMKKDLQSLIDRHFMGARLVLDILPGDCGSSCLWMNIKIKNKWEKTIMGSSVPLKIGKAGNETITITGFNILPTNTNIDFR
jgi:hypothetical protein